MKNKRTTIDRNQPPSRPHTNGSRFPAMQEEITRLAMRIAFVLAGVILLATALPSVLAGAAAWAVERYNLGANRFEMWVLSAPIIALILGAVFVIAYGPKSRKKAVKSLEKQTGDRRLALVEAQQEDITLDRDAVQSELLREGLELAVRFARLRNERKQEVRLREQHLDEEIYREEQLARQREFERERDRFRGGGEGKRAA